MMKRSKKNIKKNTFSDTHFSKIIANLARKYNSPKKVQSLLKKFNYNKEDTLRSAVSCYHSKSAHCLEAAFLAAAILEELNYPPIVISFESKDGLDHVIYVFKEGHKWGSLGRSRDLGLHGRAPKFTSLHELALSYYDPYVDLTGRITAYQVVHLDETQSDWRNSKLNVWKAEKYLLELPHIKVKSSNLRYRKLKSNYLKNGPLTKGTHWW
ncbi:MAG: hypothetical protein KDD45_01825 [Bdellovibrionales bacterium]|nr:hypothetical protein [Bdellovibrionales bacterium]